VAPTVLRFAHRTSTTSRGGTGRAVRRSVGGRAVRRLRAVRHAVVSISLCLVALGFNLLAEHLETVKARVTHLARLALGAEVTVATGELVDDAVHACIAFIRCL